MNIQEIFKNEVLGIEIEAISSTPNGLPDGLW